MHDGLTKELSLETRKRVLQINVLMSRISVARLAGKNDQSMICISIKLLPIFGKNYKHERNNLVTLC